MLVKYGILLISAWCYGIAFMYPLSLSWLLFFTYGLLFYYGLTVRFSFLNGLLWGVIAFGVHLWPLLSLFISSAYGQWRVSGWVFLVLYTSLYAGLCFTITDTVSHRVTQGDGMKVALSIFTLWLFIVWLDAYFLWIFDNVEGYCCFHPLVPLMSFNCIRLLVLHVGKQWATFAVLIWCALGALSVATYRTAYRRVFLGMLCSMCAYTVSLNHHSFYKPEWLARIAWISINIPVACGVHSQDCAYSIYMAVKQVRQMRPDVKLIVMPESSFPFALNSHPEALALWQTALQEVDGGGDLPILIVGSHRASDTKLFNTCYVIDQDGIKAYYDKRHRLFFAERLPKWFAHYKPVCDLFLKNHRAFTQGTISQDILCSIDGITYMACICSELFFDCWTKAQADVLVCLINDGWYKGSSLPDLLYLSGRLRAITESRDIIYVSHSRGIFIDHLGREILL
jgi:apolipoprotein N-acyltransferase